MNNQQKVDGNVIDMNNIISCENKPKGSNSIKAKNKRSKHKKRRVVLVKNKEDKSLLITQKVRVTKQKSNCIVNLNTNIVYNGIEKRKQNKRNKHSKDKNNSKSTLSSRERIVPMCFRCKCINQRRMSDKRIKDEKQKHHHSTSRRKKSRIKHADKKHLKQYQHKDINHNNKSMSLTPISLDSFPDNEKDISYEDISLDSFSSITEIDTLIKRTKNREKLMESGNCEYIEISSDNTESIHSVATYILQTVPIQSYSPTSLKNEPECVSHYKCENIYEKSVKRTNLIKPQLLDKIEFSLAKTQMKKSLKNEPYVPTQKIFNC